MISQIFQTFFYQPLFHSLVFIYNTLPYRDIGLAIIFLTMAIKILTFPLNAWAFGAQQSLSKIQPLLKEIKEKYKDKPEIQASQMKELFQKEKVNPLASLLPLLIQLPILFALYQLFGQSLWQDNKINPFLFGLINLSQPGLVFALTAAIFQFFQSSKSGNQGNEALQKQILFIFPAFTFFILLKLPAGLGLYWTANSVFAILETAILKRYNG